MILLQSDSERARRQAYQTISRQRTQLLTPTRSTFASVLQGELRDVIRLLQNTGFSALENLESVIQPNRWQRGYEGLYLLAGRAVVADGFDVRKSFFDDVVRDQIIQYINTVGAEKITDVTETSIKLYRNILTNSVSEGLNIFETMKTLTDKINTINVWRSEMIARTEIVAASNAASYLGAQNLGQLIKKQWLTASDSRVRGIERPENASHAAMNGQVQDMNAAFSDPVNGDLMLFPGDVSNGATAKSVINCRCAIIYKRI
jgi:hypothetical protein